MEERQRSARKRVRRAEPAANVDAAGVSDGFAPARDADGDHSSNSRGKTQQTIRLVSFSELKDHPEYGWLADNEAIQTGYRVGLSCRQAARSCCSLHTETVNVWSHACGAFVFLLLLAHLALVGVNVLSGGQVEVPVGGSDTCLAGGISNGTCNANWAIASGAPSTLPQPSRITAFLARCNADLASAGDALSALSETAAGSGDSSPVTGALEKFACSVAALGQSAEEIASQYAATLVETAASAAPDLSQSELVKSLNGFVADVKSAGQSAARLLEDAQSGVANASATSLDAASTLYVDVRDKLQRFVDASASSLDQAAVQPMLAKLEPFLRSAHDSAAALGTAAHHAMAAGVASLAGEEAVQALGIDDGRAPAPAEAAEDAFFAAPEHRAEAQRQGYVPHAHPVPQWPIGIFIMSAIACMTASAVFHLFHVVNKSVFETLARLDYSFISLLICGSSLPLFYYGFWCHPGWMRTYSALSVLTNGACMVMGLSDKFRTTEWRLVRMSAFLASGLFGAIPFSHMLLASEEQNVEAVYGLALMGLLYVSGALMYGFRVPERFFPGRLDIFGTSHQLFHINVFLACVVHYYSTVSHYRWRVDRSVCALD